MYTHVLHVQEILWATFTPGPFAIEIWVLMQVCYVQFSINCVVLEYLDTYGYSIILGRECTTDLSTHGCSFLCILT